MRCHVLRQIGWLLTLLVVMVVPGCRRESTSLPTESAAKEIRQFARDDQVAVLKEVGDFALVKGSDGQESFVALGLLKHRNTGVRSADKSYTHTVVRDTPTYSQPPSQLPAPLPPRGLAEIDLEQRTLNGLFISEKTGKRVIAPRNVPQFLIDEETGERCWHVYECTHPNCPGKRPEGFIRYVFIHTEVDSQRAIHCPACEKIRNLRAETEAQWQQWGQYVQPYELPETLRRRAELSAERRQAIEAMRSGAMPPTP